MSGSANSEGVARLAPIIKMTALRWMRENLFSTWYNSVLTVIALYILYVVVSGLWDWGIVNAVWEAENRRECFDIIKKMKPDDPHASGACWAGVIIWFDNIIYGRYPRTDLWRLNLGAILLIIWMAPLWMPNVKGKIITGLTVVFLYPFLATYLFGGGDKGLFAQIMVSLAILGFIAATLNAVIGVTTGGNLPAFLVRLLGLGAASEKRQRNALLLLTIVVYALIYWWQSGWVETEVKWNKWGGLFLTLVISGIGIASALPGGIILALGRRSQMPIIRVLSVTFIELFRSVPLITVLFMATTMFPLFLPEGFVLNKLVQVIIAVCLFNACYMAETVRAGLQAIPKGQYEAASALGLGYWRMMGLVVMPQALKHMIPNIVGSFIGLLKDTTLVSIIGLFDILRMLQSISQDVPWRGLHKEPLFVGAVLFFVICFAMSKYSRHLERKLSTER